ncbi:MAG: UDP-3-O-[3-hydroxymyristoyl] N-acetylglucosamine deacetylase [Oligoflexales bacterium]|nr:UDP-3-O-[3-hydroxymyristoyl] N-acetylglucosamine deacetylase [Oligoflexales bacterium]
MQYQRTLNRPIKFRGVGLHSGKLVDIAVFPTEADHGIVFQRTDKSYPPIKAIPENILTTNLNTTLGFGDNSISTIEHLMAAFSGLGIDNALVKVNASEIPILDGSAAPFIDILLIAGSKRLPVFKKKILVIKPFEIVSGDSRITIEPNDNEELEFSCYINFSNSQAIGEQKLKFTLKENSIFDICEARTFCHIKDVEYMRTHGLALGGSLDNAVVVDDLKVMNAEGLRFNDEFVRHKMLDCIGDLALLNAQIIGKITLHKPGHGLHAKFTQQFEKLEDQVWKQVKGESPSRLLFKRSSTQFKPAIA